MRSLRTRLIVTLLAATFAALGGAGIATYLQAKREIDALFDYQLKQLALSLRDQNFLAVPPSGSGPGEPDFDFVIQVWDRFGMRVYSSHPQRPAPQQVVLGLGTVHTDDGPWRAVGLRTADRVVQVAQPIAVRETLAARSALQTIAPLSALLPLLGLLIWLIVGRELAPLSRLTSGLRRQNSEHLAQLPVPGLPDEAVPLVQALNDLLGRVHQSREAQRAFVADAAHELRTPLTALRLQVQLAQRARDTDERARSLAELAAGVARASRTVEQLLALARAGPEAGPLALRPVPLAEIWRGAATECETLAAARGIDLGAETLDESVSVAGDADALRLLLSNLVSNAVQYTPRGGTVDLACG
ncbi:MAG: two-component sensor histidine kinase, partial [Burkholderiales bacterium]